MGLRFVLYFDNVGSTQWFRLFYSVLNLVLLYVKLCSRFHLICVSFGVGFGSCLVPRD